MSEDLFDTDSTPRARVMIVDDDEISASLLESLLEDEFETCTLPSGEACLDHVIRFSPDVVLLDIQMDGIDGYETCRRLHTLEEWSSPTDQPVVIFFSGHDTLEERLKAYESGGDDFIAKPPAPEEVLSKVRALVTLVAERKRVQSEKDSMQKMAMSFLTNLGESGVALQFLRSGLACTDMADLARLTIAALRDYDLDANVQLGAPGRTKTFVPSGTATPLEESVFEQVRKMERIFQFRRKIVINYPHVSILVNNFPIEDEERCGRLRDHLAIIAEGCEASMLALLRDTEIRTRTALLQDTAAGVEHAIVTLREQYRALQAETRLSLHDLNQFFAKELMYLGLSDVQEEQMLAILSRGIEQTMTAFDKGLDFDSQLGGLLANIRGGGPASDPSRV
ncbi:MAG: response regulator [Proteobacteria bacterium]|nr:response regulator [Pseudomonadota bacterium]